MAENPTVVGWLRDRAVACAFAAVLAIGTAVLIGLGLSAPAAPACLPGERQAAELSQNVQALSGAPPSSTTLEVADVKETQIALGRAVAPARTQIAVKTDVMPADSEINAPVGVRVQSFRTGDGGDVSQAVLAWGTFTSRHTAEIALCIERQGPGDNTHYAFYLVPGTYTGAVTILDDRLPATTIPFTVELAYADPYGPLAPLGPIILGGSLYLMVLRRSGGEAEVGLKDLDKYLKRPSGVAAIVAGTAAALGVYISTYLSSDTWGSAGSDFFVLAGSMFTAFVSAGTAFRFASNLDTSAGPAATATDAPTRNVTTSRP